MKLSNKIIKLLTESYIFSDENLYYNLDKFKNNTLIITGFSGSGKTTISKLLAIKYNAKLISSDDIHEKYSNDKSSDNFIKELKFIIFQNKENIILEGIHFIGLYDQLDKNDVLQLPIILIGRSIFVSTLNAIKRDRFKYGIIDPLFTNTKFLKHNYDLLYDDLNKK